MVQPSLLGAKLRLDLLQNKDHIRTVVVERLRLVDVVPEIIGIAKLESRHTFQQPAELRGRIHAKRKFVTHAKRFAAVAGKKAHAKSLDASPPVGFHDAQRHTHLCAALPLGPPFAIILGGVGRQHVKAEDIDSARPQGIGDAFQMSPCGGFG